MILLPESGLLAPDLLYPKRKPASNVRSSDPAMRGAWFNFRKPNLISGEPLTVTSDGAVIGKGNLVTSGSGESAQLDSASTDALWPHFKPFTYFIRLKFNSVGPNFTEKNIFQNVTVNSTNYIKIYAKSNGSSWSIRTYVSGSVITGSFTVESGDYLNLILTRDSNNSVYLYTDDTLQGSSTVSAEIYNRHGTHYHRLTYGGFDLEFDLITVSHRFTPLNEVKLLCKDPYRLFSFVVPMPLIIGEAAGGVTGTIGIATESNSSQPISSADFGLIGLSTESDISQPVSAVKIGQILGAIESDVSQSITGLSLLTIGQAAETDSALVFSAEKLSVIAQAVESDTVYAIASSGATLLNQAHESDSAFTITGIKLGSINVVAEADKAQSISGVKLSHVGQAFEIDTSQIITSSEISLINQVTELDISQSTLGYKSAQISQVVELDSVFSVASINVVNVGQAVEADVAQIINSHKASTIGLVVESDTALAIYGQTVNVPSNIVIELSVYKTPIELS